MSSDRILRQPSVSEITGNPKSTLYAKVKSGEFPKPISLGARSVGWREKEVIDWLNTRPLADAHKRKVLKNEHPPGKPRSNRKKRKRLVQPGEIKFK